MSTLSIGIPTFNRKSVVTKNILNILSDNLLSKHDITLIVSDNASPDGTFDAICKIKKNTELNQKFKVIKNDSNLGVFQNIFKLFEAADSKYLLITSDEEFIIKENFYLLTCFLEREKPSFVSPQFFLGDRLYRGKRKSRVISIDEWHRSGFFTSGLIFDVELAKKIIAEYYPLLTADNLYYVQNLLIAELMIDKPGSQWFLDFPLTTQKFKEPTRVFIDNKYQYSSVPGRWESFLAIDNYFLSRHSNETNDYAKNILMKFVKHNRCQLYNTFVHAIKLVDPVMLKDFRAGAVNYELGRLAWVLNKIIALKWLIKNALIKLVRSK